MYARRTALTSSDILALSGTPIELVPAPGPDKVILFKTVMIQFTFGTMAYTAGSNLRVYYGSAGTGRYVSSTTNTFLQATADKMYQQADTIISFTYSPPSNLVNSALVLTVDGADFATGDGTAVLVIEYTIECVT